MVEQESTPDVSKELEPSNEVLRAQRGRARSLKFKRARAEFASSEEWKACISSPLRAKADPEWIVCLVCRQMCKTLGLHLKPHNVSAEWYKELFSYPEGEKLICDSLAEKLGRQPDDSPRGTAEETARAREGKNPLRSRDWILCPGSQKEPCGLKLKQITVLHVSKHGFSTLNEFRDEWFYPWRTPLVCESISQANRSRALQNGTLKFGKKGTAPPRHKGYKMSKAFSLKQSERLLGKKRAKRKPVRGLGKNTARLLSLLAAFQKVAMAENREINIYATAPVLYPLNRQRPQKHAESAFRNLQKRHQREIDRLSESMTEAEARQQIAAASPPLTKATSAGS